MWFVEAALLSCIARLQELGLGGYSSKGAKMLDREGRWVLNRLDDHDDYSLSRKVPALGDGTVGE